MNLKLLSILFALAIGFGISPVYESASAKEVKFNDDWKFKLGDLQGAENPDCDDSGWQLLSLPHDWSITMQFDENAGAGNDGGYLPDGIGWYRKNLKLSPKQIGKKHQLYFEGAYMNTDVYVNGHHVKNNRYGYSSFFAALTPFLKTGDNTIAVRVDNSMQKNCRWYSGSGIFRNVWLKETEDVHIANWGVQISTPTLESAIVKVSIANDSDKEKKVVITTGIGGTQESTELLLAPGEQSYAIQKFSVPDANIWSPDSPYLYTACVSLTENDKQIDNIDQKFGFRTLEWSATAGFMLNGKQLEINGSCVHHDNGILGAAAYDRAEYKRVELLKNAGFNAVRTSHNIPSETFLNACDELGLMVIDEAFDGWRDAKNKHDYHEIFDTNWKEDLDVMILRDFNHPSIICWSIGNEVIERDKIEVVTTAKKLADRCRQLDPSRPVTSALANWGKVWETYDPLAAQHDIVGYNYIIDEAEKDHLRLPDRVMWQTESYPNDAWKNFCKTKDYPYIIGDFVWTGIDYNGESGIGRWYYEGDVPGEHYPDPLYPWHASYCGDIDLTGLRKSISHYRSMLWNEKGEHLYMAVKEPDNYRGKIQTTQWGTWPTFQSWNWPGYEGKEIEVEVYSHYPTVRLYLNDRLIGEKNVKEMKVAFILPYAEGTLRAEGIKDGKIMEEKYLKTAGEVAGIRLTPDRIQLNADNSDLSYIVIEMVDEEGNIVPVADNKLTVEVSGNATLQALGNADIKDLDPYFDNTHKVWKGRALAVVRSNGKKGSARVKVSSPGLKSKTLKLTSR